MHGGVGGDGSEGVDDDDPLLLLLDVDEGVVNAVHLTKVDEDVLVVPVSDEAGARPAAQLHEVQHVGADRALLVGARHLHEVEKDRDGVLVENRGDEAELLVRLEVLQRSIAHHAA